MDVGRREVEGLRRRLAGREEREQDRRREDGSLRTERVAPPGLPLLDLEVLARLEVEDPGDDVRRDGLERVVVGEDGIVVHLARDRDLLLRVGELRLELLEVLRRPQLRVGLGDREDLPDRLRQDVLGLGLLLDAFRLLRRRARLRHLFEGLALVRRVSLHRLDEVGDEVVAAPSWTSTCAHAFSLRFRRRTSLL